MAGGKDRDRPLFKFLWKSLAVQDHRGIQWKDKKKGIFRVWYPRIHKNYGNDCDDYQLFKEYGEYCATKPGAQRVDSNSDVKDFKRNLKTALKTAMDPKKSPFLLSDSDSKPKDDGWKEYQFDLNNGSVKRAMAADNIDVGDQTGVQDIIAESMIRAGVQQSIKPEPKFFNLQTSSDIPLTIQGLSIGSKHDSLNEQLPNDLTSLSSIANFNDIEMTEYLSAESVHKTSLEYTNGDAVYKLVFQIFYDGKVEGTDYCDRRGGIYFTSSNRDSTSETEDEPLIYPISSSCQDERLMKILDHIEKGFLITVQHSKICVMRHVQCAAAIYIRSSFVKEKKLERNENAMVFDYQLFETMRDEKFNPPTHWIEISVGERFYPDPTIPNKLVFRVSSSFLEVAAQKRLTQNPLLAANNLDLPANSFENMSIE